MLELRQGLETLQSSDIIPNFKSRRYREGGFPEPPFSVKFSTYTSRRWQARPRILLLPHSQHFYSPCMESFTGLLQL